MKTMLAVFFAAIMSMTPAGELFGQKTKATWFPEKCLFPMLEYDLMETQPYAGIFLLRSDKVKYDGVYIPVNIGFRLSFLQWQTGAVHFDVAMGAASYTQFDVARFDQQNFRGGLLNTDFKASGFLYATFDQHHFRLQLFHVSSHLGDDYILRNTDVAPNDKSVNYEQIDITYLYSLNRADVYAGVGYVITGHAFRARTMLQLGVQTAYPLGDHLDLNVGGDMKLYQENDFVPDIHFCSGVTIRTDKHPRINFSIDAYLGNLPYSTLDFGRVSWLGLSSRIYL